MSVPSHSLPIELLSPAKNVEVGRAAIDAGADAVYIGGPAFGARKDAGNTIEDIAALVDYARLWQARVLVTLNTLLKDEEYDEALRIAYDCKRIGVHALIIQDMRLARMLLSTGDFSGTDDGIRLHASTQCDNRTVEQVQALEKMGFRRVVLARELSYNEITDIRANTTCELEAFVHGALCVSYSGRCFLSEAVCGRSANRGECAQMCRLPYDILDEKKQLIAKDRHILSLYDLDRSAHLKELLQTGVTTLKIEGRLKDISYVRNITAYYNRLLEHLGCRRTARGRVELNFQPDPEKTFHRGSTEYFSFTRPDNLVNQLTPKSTGEMIGYAPLPEGLIAGKALHNGDGLTYDGVGMYWQPGAKIDARKGLAVYRNYDAEFNRQISGDKAAIRKLPVQITFEECLNGIQMSMHTLSDSEDKSANGDGVSLVFDCEKTVASNPERAEAVLKQQLSKLGGTPLVAENISVRWSQPLFLSAAFLNDCRRRLTEHFLSQFSSATQDALSATADDKDAYITTIKRSVPYTGNNSVLPEALMTCKYCILYELGCCKKNSPTASHRPTFLRTGKTLLRIQTDCKRCEMMLVAENV